MTYPTPKLTKRDLDLEVSVIKWGTFNLVCKYTYSEHIWSLFLQYNGPTNTQWYSHDHFWVRGGIWLMDQSDAFYLLHSEFRGLSYKDSIDLLLQICNHEPIRMLTQIKRCIHQYYIPSP